MGYVCSEVSSRIRSVIGGALTLAFLLGSAAVFASQNPWTPDLESTRGRLEFLQSVSQAHPGLPVSNLQFRRNPYEALLPISSLSSELGPHAAALKIGPSRVMGAEYSSGGDWIYSEEKLGAIRGSLVEDLKKLELRSLKGMGEDFASLKSQLKAGDPARFQKAYPQQSGRLLRLMPFLYDSEGRPLYSEFNQSVKDTVARRIAEQTPGSLENLYLDLLKKEQKAAFERTPTISQDKQLLSLFQSMENQFIERQLRPAVTPAGKDGAGIKVRAVSVEEVPSPVAVFRGCKGGDCSMLSVPYYPLVKDSKTYWIRKSLDASRQPDGYAFVVSAKIGGRTLPYVVTTNGVTLTDQDVNQVLRLIADDWKVSEIVLPDFQKNPRLVNTKQIVQGMTIDGAKPAQVKLPNGWSAIEQYQEAHKLGSYENYYRGDKISDAKIVSVNKIDAPPMTKAPVKTVMRYAPIAEIDKQPLFERAILAASALADDKTNPAEHKEVLRVLRVTPAQAEQAGVFMSATHVKPVTGEQFLEMQRHIGVKLQDLNHLDTLTRAHSLGKIQEGYPSAASAEEWAEIVRKTNQQLDSVLLREDVQILEFEAAVRAKRDLPRRYASGIWDFLPEVLQSKRNPIRQRGVRLTLEMAEDLPPRTVEVLMAALKAGDVAVVNDMGVILTKGELKIPLAFEKEFIKVAPQSTWDRFVWGYGVRGSEFLARHFDEVIRRMSEAQVENLIRYFTEVSEHLSPDQIQSAIRTLIDRAPEKSVHQLAWKVGNLGPEKGLALIPAYLDRAAMLEASDYAFDSLILYTVGQWDTSGTAQAAEILFGRMPEAKKARVMDMLAKRKDVGALLRGSSPFSSCLKKFLRIGAQ